METKPKILAFAGSVRKDSYNRKLIRIAAAGAGDAGADVTLIELRDFPLPLFDQDLEAEIGVHPNARTLKDIFLEHQGLLISAPEYNSSITPLLKNTIDWVSRAEPDRPSLYYIGGKIASLMSASPGKFGGLRGLVVVRMLLGNCNVTVLPGQVSVPNAADAFTPDGALADRNLHQSVQKLGATLSNTLARLQH